MDETIYKIAIAGLLHDIGKFAERAHDKTVKSGEKLTAGFYPDEKFLNDNMDLYQPHFKGRYTHRHAVYTAAFIDHIEKLLPEQFYKNKWGLGDSFANLAAGHHNPKTATQWIIAMADRVGSGFDRQEFEYDSEEISVRDYKKTRLLTIFESINIGEKWKDNLDDYNFRYQLKELGQETIFPVKKDDYKNDRQKEYDSLFFEFINSLEKIEHKNNIPLWFEHFDSLFMIYASNIPAATVGKVISDVSLYDHSKMTAALASAIYLYHSDNEETAENLKIEAIRNYDDKKFLIVTGNIYGIQSFIFSEGGSTDKAAAKLLRGRSFSISLMSELAADMLCRELGLTVISIVLNAAGKFTIIAPNTKDARKKIILVEKKINDWLIKFFYGESIFGISFVEASCNDFTIAKFNELLEKLAKESENRKLSKIDMEKYGGVIQNYLDQFDNNLNKKLCPFCGKRPANLEVENNNFLGDEKSACKICRDHIYIGANLVKEKRIAVTTVDADIYGDKLKEPLFGIYQIAFDVSGKLNELANKNTLFKHWDISIGTDGNIAKDVTAKFINGYVPKYTEEDNNDLRIFSGRESEETKLESIDDIKLGAPKTFLHIAKKALNPTDKDDIFIGTEALGCLKADIDSLGLIFGVGLKNNNLSRTAALSRQINYYFTIYLPYILSTKIEFKDIYTVFAGGDDLFLIGPWNRIIDFAYFLHTSFKEYVCGNPDITISAGISINKPGEPVHSISERVENALKNAKANDKNSITLFRETVKWSEFKELNEIKDKMGNWVKNKFINNGMLFRFNAFSDMARQEKTMSGLDSLDMEDLECFKWRAKLKYTLVRNMGKNVDSDTKEEAINEISHVAKWFETYGGAVKVPLWQIIYNQR